VEKQNNFTPLFCDMNMSLNDDTYLKIKPDIPYGRRSRRRIGFQRFHPTPKKFPRR